VTQQRSLRVGDTAEEQSRRRRTADSEGRRTVEEARGGHGTPAATAGAGPWRRGGRGGGADAAVSRRDERE